MSPRLFCRRTYVINASGRCILTLRAAINASSASTMTWPVLSCSLKPTANCNCASLFLFNHSPATVYCLFDHLVGAGEQHRRHVEAKHFGRLTVDDQFELGRLHDRQLSRL